MKLNLKFRITNNTIKGSINWMKKNINANFKTLKVVCLIIFFLSKLTISNVNISNLEINFLNITIY